MLYRTHHHPFLFTFNPSFPHTPRSSLLPPHHLLPPSSPSPLPFQEMECGLKNGFGSDTVKTPALVDDFTTGDEFFVDELLDFSNGFSEPEEEPEKEPEEEKTATKTCSVSLETTENGSLTVNDDFGSLPESDLSIPAEGLESLEWLSHFVEDSFSDYRNSLTGKLPPKSSENRSEPAVMVQEQPCFATPVQTKARTKRARTGVRVWPVLSPSFTESSTSSSSSTSSTTSFPPQNLWPGPSQAQTGDSFGKPVGKKPKKTGDGSTGGAQPRRCTHCGVTKTPQWRAGPQGSKTLCNACGVRFKSGRLLPEYRPACSPTFSSELHSNNHRKVLEMRRKKEVETEPAGLLRSF